MEERNEIFRDELRQTGYSLEEAYFNRINTDLIRRQQKGLSPGTTDTGAHFAQASGTFTPVRWDEKPYEILSQGARLSKAIVEYNFHGQLEGRGRAEYLFFYRHYNEADVHQSESAYTGLIHWSGTLSGRTGTFVFQETGNYGQGTANSTFTILPGSGTDELKGIIGTGRIIATPTEAHFEIEYVLPEH